MTAATHVAGIVLAGGQSRRMGGIDKSLQPLGGKPLLAHVAARVAPQVACLIVNANGEPERFAAFGLPVVADDVTGFAGPLAGIHAGLSWFANNRPDITHAVTVASDTPFIPADLASRFLAARGDERTLRVARSQAGLHPVIGLWPVALAPLLEESLKQGARKASAWVQEHGAVEVMFPDVEIAGTSIDPFFNINRPEDLAEAEELLRRRA